MCEKKNKISLEERNNGIIFKQCLLKDGKEVFTFNEYIDGRWQVIGNVSLVVAKKIFLSPFSKNIWIEGREPNLDPDKYATISYEQLEVMYKNNGKKPLYITDFVSFSKKSGFPRFIKSYDILLNFDLKYFIKFLEDNDLVDHS